ncbi:Ccw14 protein [Maudiozyma humilis]|uniref:Ccw14 protein n=1 Tax=Maudiozyma humilis TaxID=51915 RepID=A0AAV5S2D4_MAUHU|nr:Ccw14 protein [Kazachstania humilis]
MRTSTVVSSVLSLALLSKEVLATPPACLLACVAKVTSASSQCNTLSNVDCVCQNENSAVKSCLDEICPNGNADAAYSAFKSSCSAQNVSLGDNSSSSSSSASSSSTQASSSSASSTEASSTEASSTEVSSTEVSSTKASSTEASTSEAPVTSASITSVAKETTASEAPATSASSTHAVVTVSQGSGNLLQLGGSVAAIAAAALLI